MKQLYIIVILFFCLVMPLSAEVYFEVLGEINNFKGNLGIYEVQDSLVYGNLYGIFQLSPTNPSELITSDFEIIDAENVGFMNEPIINMKLKNTVYDVRLSPFIVYLAYSNNNAVRDSICYSWSSDNSRSRYPSRIALIEQNNEKKLIIASNGQASLYNKSFAWILSFTDYGGYFGEKNFEQGYSAFDPDKMGFEAYDYSNDFLNSKYILSGFNGNMESTYEHAGRFLEVKNFRRQNANSPIMRYVKRRNENRDGYDYLMLKTDVNTGNETVTSLTTEQARYLKDIKAATHFIDENGNQRILAFYYNLYRILDANTFEMLEAHYLPAYLCDKHIEFDYLFSQNKAILKVCEENLQQHNTHTTARIVAFSFTAPTASSSSVNTAKQFMAFNYPNPFNPSTTIEYILPKTTNVNVSIYNVKGQKIKTLVNKKQNAGKSTVFWNGFDNNGNTVGSGIYFYKIRTKSKTLTKKMILIK